MKEIQTIGILSRNYAARRLFLDKLAGVRYKDVRVSNWCMWNKAPLWLLKMLHCLPMSPERMVSLLFYDFRAIWSTGCDVFHFFNCINHSHRSPWIVSVESGVPWPMNVIRAVEAAEPDFSLIRKDAYVQARIRDLASPNCLALIPLSTCSYGIQMEILRQFPEYEATIKAKTYTLHPPQQLLVDSLNDKGLTWEDDEEFHFIYVGANCYRKGGVESLEVLVELRRKYKKFKLTMISALLPDEKRYMRDGNIEKWVREIIATNSDWIEFHPSLPNDQVLEKMKKAHVCLLPTWMDTYAYSVLESQACGTPVISTNQRALGEINPDEVGWLIDVPLNRLYNPLNQTPAQREVFHRKLFDGLLEKCEYVLTHREEVKVKAHAALERIRQHHSPEEYAAKLKKLYQGRVHELIRDGAAAKL